MRRLCVRVPASIANLGPGYDILALALESPYDIVCAELTEGSDVDVRLEGPFANHVKINAISELTVYPVIEEFRRIVGTRFGVKVIVHKGIKPASGLGSSGADAAGIAYILNKLLNLGLSNKDLVRIASLGEIVSAGAPHMDNVSASLLGGLVIINPVTNDLLQVRVSEDLWLLVVMAGSKASTSEMRKVVPREVPIESFKNNAAYVAMIVHSLMTGDAETLGKAVSNDSIVEPRRAPLYPHYSLVRNALIKFGAVGVSLAGAGPSMFGIFRERPPVNLISDSLRSLELTEHQLILTRPSNQGVLESNFIY
ncbi:MAG: homoserine kinase [Vulcanisaeta sp. AZ3]|jgi:homoserine kinase|nr:MAG: serine kinase [Vulcanisaeta sp. AZ3]